METWLPDRRRLGAEAVEAVEYGRGPSNHLDLRARPSLRQAVGDRWTPEDGRWLVAQRPEMAHRVFERQSSRSHPVETPVLGREVPAKGADQGGRSLSVTRKQPPAEPGATESPKTLLVARWPCVKRSFLFGHRRRRSGWQVVVSGQRKIRGHSFRRIDFEGPGPAWRRRP